MAGLELDKLVLDYLRLKGYEKAVEGLKTHGVASQGQSDAPVGNNFDLQDKLAKNLLNWANIEVAKSKNRGPEDNEARTVNQEAIKVGWLEDDLEAECSKILDKELNAEVDEGNERNAQQKRKRQEEDASARKRRAKAVVQAEIPLPSPSDEEKYRLLEHMRGRVTVSKADPPSSVMYTFLNVPGTLNCVASLYEGRKIAGGFGDTVIRVFDMEEQLEEDRQKEVERSGAEIVGRHPTAELNGHTKGVTSLSWFREDALLASSSVDGTVRLWSERLGSNLAVFKGHVYPVWDVAACPRGFYFATAGHDKTARLWCTERLEPVRLFAGHIDSVDCVCWHPSCNLLATSASNGTVRMWDVNSGKCVRILPNLNSAVAAMMFGPDEKTLLVGTESGKLHGWDVSSASEIGQCQAHNGPVWALDLSKGTSSTLATGGGDNSLKLWGTGSSDFLKPVKVWRTRATPVQGVFWTERNFLIGAGTPRLNKGKNVWLKGR